VSVFDRFEISNKRKAAVREATIRVSLDIDWLAHHNVHDDFSRARFDQPDIRLGMLREVREILCWIDTLQLAVEGQPASLRRSDKTKGAARFRVGSFEILWWRRLLLWISRNQAFLTLLTFSAQAPF
jgi:hypothetical protein